MLFKVWDNSQVTSKNNRFIDNFYFDYVINCKLNYQQLLLKYVWLDKVLITKSMRMTRQCRNIYECDNLWDKCAFVRLSTKLENQKENICLRQKLYCRSVGCGKYFELPFMCVYVVRVGTGFATDQFLSSESYYLSKYEILTRYQVLTPVLLKASGLLAFDAVSIGE